MTWYTWVFDGFGGAAAVALGSYGFKRLFDRASKSAQNAVVQNIDHSPGSLQVGGNLFVVLDQLPRMSKVKLLPLADAERRRQNLRSLFAGMGPADMTLKFISQRWGFQVDFEVPSAVLVEAVIHTLVEGLDLPTVIHVRRLGEDIGVSWQLQNIEGEAFDPMRSLASVGLVSGDSIYLRATTKRRLISYFRQPRHIARGEAVHGIGYGASSDDIGNWILLSV